MMKTPSIGSWTDFDSASAKVFISLIAAVESKGLRMAVQTPKQRIGAELVQRVCPVLPAWKRRNPAVHGLCRIAQVIPAISAEDDFGRRILRPHRFGQRQRIAERDHGHTGS